MRTDKWTKLYNKRDDFNFLIVNFPFIFSKIPAAPAYGVYISPLIQYSMAFGSHHYFLERFAVNKEATEPMVQVVKSWSHQFQSFTIAIMTWLTVVQYLCHKLPRIYSICRNHNPVLSLFMTYHRVYNMSNTTCATSGAGTVYPSRAPEFTTYLLGVMLFNL